MVIMLWNGEWLVLHILSRVNKVNGVFIHFHWKLTLMAVKKLYHLRY